MSHALCVRVAAALSCMSLCARIALAEEQRIYVRGIPDAETWQRYSRELGADRFSKFIIDLQSKDIYFFDVNVYRLHADFVFQVLWKVPWSEDAVREYNRNYERNKPRFILGYITHHQKNDVWTFAFWEGDKIDAAGIIRVAKQLRGAFFKPLRFRPDSPAQLAVADVVRGRGVPTITNDQIYKSAPYQPFHNGTAVGTLRVVRPGTPYESLTFAPTDIVLLQESYPDISPVAGIITTIFSTPLSHVNLRATAWGIPNAGYVDAYAKYSSLDGKVVYYEVSDTRHVLRPATTAEMETYQRARVRHVDLPPANLTNANMPMLDHIGAEDITSYGAKTANLGEIASAKLAGVNVPAGFGVPFFYYVRHLRQSGLDKKIRALLEDPRFAGDAAWRKAELESLRAAIQSAPLDPEVLSALYKRVKVKLGGAGVFVRSSTNAEDLDGFSGAGLYDTVPNVRGKQALGEAVKKVWASLWNYRAVEERALFGIDHRQVYAGVLIQVGVDATAAGVLITANLYDPSEDDSFTINAKWGLGIRVVEGKRVPEQVIYDTVNFGTKIISRSDDATILVFDKEGGIREVENPHRGVILTEARAKRLSEVVMRFRPLFPREYPLDVEWLFAGETVWIVQARPYVGDGRRK